jgi:hypothetical protein
MLLMRLFEQSYTELRGAARDRVGLRGVPWDSRGPAHQSDRTYMATNHSHVEALGSQDAGLESILCNIVRLWQRYLQIDILQH